MKQPAPVAMRLADFPEFVAVDRCYNDLKSRKSDVDQKLNQTLNEISRNGSQASRTSRIAAAAAALTTLPVTERDVIDTQALRRSATELTEERNILAKAIEIQRQLREEQIDRCSVVICNAVRAEHTNRVRRIVLAVIELALAHDAESRLRQDLRDQYVRVDSHLRPMPFVSVGSLSDRESRASAYLREAVEFEFIAAAEQKAMIDQAG